MRYAAFERESNDEYTVLQEYGRKSIRRRSFYRRQDLLRNAMIPVCLPENGLSRLYDGMDQGNDRGMNKLVVTVLFQRKLYVFTAIALHRLIAAAGFFLREANERNCTELSGTVMQISCKPDAYQEIKGNDAI
jgi:hypothetical protein